jgi:capsid protein
MAATTTRRRRAPASQGQSGIVLTGRDSYPPVKQYFGGGNNRLIPTAQPTLDRKYTWMLDHDIHRNVTNYGRRVMMTLGRSLYCAYDVVRGAVDEMAQNAAKSFVPEYRGADAEFEDQVHSWIAQHDRVCDIAGWPYNMLLYRELLAKCIFRDGDMGTVFVRDAAGQPKLQIIPGHRIGSGDGEPFVEGGPYDGARVISGVILGDYSNPIAYRVLLGDPSDTENFIDIPADRMILSFIPQFPGQVRGFSQIGYSAWNWQDLAEADRWELLAQKAGAGRVFQEWNQEGEPQPGADYITGPAAGTTTAGTPTGLWYETIEAGVNTYFKSSDPNAQIKAVEFNRPSSNQQQFHKSKVAEALYAAGWSDVYSLDPKAGGAALRVVIGKLNDTIDHLGDIAMEPAMSRFDAFRIPVAMEIGAIKFAPDWHNLEYIRAPKKSADRKYDIEVDEKEIRMGISTRSRKIGERGECEEDVREENERSVDDLLTRAQRLAAKHNVDLALALSLLELVTPNGNLPAAAAPAPASEAS